MNTCENHAQLAVEVLERIASKAARRDVSKPTIFPVDSLCLQTHRVPHNLEERSACIAEAAYFIAMRRDFSPGHELEDWLTAENEVDARLMDAPREY